MPFTDPVPQADALADTVPSAPTWRQRVPVPAAEETMRFVVEAVVAVIIVVEAYGKTEAVVVVAVYLPAVRLPMKVLAPEKVLLSERRVVEAVLSVPVIVTGDEPRIVCVEHETEPEHDAVVVAWVPTNPSVPEYRSPDRPVSRTGPFSVEEALVNRPLLKPTVVEVEFRLPWNG